MKLRPYQIEGRNWLAGKRQGLLADEMRVGKTPQAILAAHLISAKQGLVLCPAVAVPHWQCELPKWWPDGPDAVAAIGLEDRPRDGRAVFRVLSYDTARLHRAALDDERYDVMIPDEAHYAKNPNAARTRLVYGKGGLGWQSARIWPLSGTPAPRHVGELWPMLRAFGVVTEKYDPWLKAFCYVDDEGRVRGNRVDRLPEVRAMLAPIMLRRTRAEVAPDMPAIAFNVLPVRPAVGLLELERRLPAGLSDAEAAAWLRANAEHLAEWRIAVALAKAPPLVEEILGALAGKLYAQTVVFGHHKAPLEALCKALCAEGVRAELLTGATPTREREAIQERFRRGETEVLCANIIAAGTAIDLSAASHGYFLESDWTPGNNLQAANRLVSLDKRTGVTYDLLCWSGSFDDTIQSILARRASELAQLY